MIPSFKRSATSRRRLRFVLPALLLVSSAAFAGNPPPITNLQAAEQAIANAELGEARGKLAAAQRAVGEKDMVAAQQFADEARAQAELAAAKAGAVKALAVNEDIKRSTATLVEEMQRKSGDSR